MKKARALIVALMFALASLVITPHDTRAAGLWLGTRLALERGVSCSQKPSLSIDSGAGDPRPMGEDCLNLNLCTPRADLGDVTIFGQSAGAENVLALLAPTS